MNPIDPRFKIIEFSYCPVHGRTEFSERDPVLLRSHCLKCAAEKKESEPKSA